MATRTTELSLLQRVDIGLKGLEAMIWDLRHESKIWPKMESGELASWSLDWDQLMMTDLPEIEARFQAGELAPHQRRRYVRVRNAVQKLLPTIQRLGLMEPSIPRD